MDGELRIESSGLTVDAVFRRLGVEGLGGAVQIRPGALLLPGGKDDWAEAAPEAPEAHSQQRAMSAMAGTLVAVKLPRAKISVAGADGKATADFSVSVDDLVPAVAAVDKEQAPPEPALAEEKDATLTLPKYNFDELQGPFLRASAEVLQYALAWVFGANPLRARNAQVLMLSEKGKLPYKFQVRVRNETYKKGELVLVPYAQQALVSQESADALGTFTAKETEKVLDESLCAVAEISVHAALDGRSAEAKRAKRDGSQPTVEQKCYMQSPLLQGKAAKLRDDVYSNLAPFWAVPRCGRTLAGNNNMALIYVTLDLPPLKNAGAGVSKAPAFSAMMQVMTNTKTVRPGDALCLPLTDA